MAIYVETSTDVKKSSRQVGDIIHTSLSVMILSHAAYERIRIFIVYVQETT